MVYEYEYFRSLTSPKSLRRFLDPEESGRLAKRVDPALDLAIESINTRRTRRYALLIILICYNINNNH